MSYENPDVPHEVNVSREHAVAEFLRLLAGIGIVVLALTSLLHFGGAWLVTRIRGVRLADILGWRDILAVGIVAGVGFTVSLLITELAFEDSETLLTDAKLAVLTASVISAGLASIALMRRGRHHGAESG